MLSNLLMFFLCFPMFVCFLDAEEPLSEQATFAGGCFWCMESDFEKLDGILDVISGFSGGKEMDPSYKEVSSGSTGHREAILVTYDSRVISYKELLYHFC